MKKSKKKFQKQQGHNNFYRSSGLKSIGISSGTGSELILPSAFLNRELRRKMIRVSRIRKKRFEKNNPGMEW